MPTNPTAHDASQAANPLPCVCGNYHLTTAERLKAHPDARVLPPISVDSRNAIAKFVSSLDRPSVVIPIGWCWACASTVCRGHKLTSPISLLVARLRA